MSVERGGDEEFIARGGETGERIRALNESEERFRTLADDAPVLIWVNGLEGAEYVNRTYTEFLGVEEPDLQGFDWTQYVHPDDLAGYVDAYLRALESRSTFDAEFRFLRHDGEYRWMRSVGRPRFTRGGEFVGYVGSSIDVTGQKLSEAAVRESEERFRSLVPVLTDVPFTTDPSGAFVEQQPAWEAYTGQTWEEYRGLGWIEALHPDDRDRVRAKVASQSASEIYESAGRLWHAGTQRYRHYVARATPLTAEDGSVREWVGACTDVHERARDEADTRLLGKLNEQIRIAADPVELVYEVAVDVGEHLDVRRSFFVEVDEDRDVGIVRRDHTRGVESVAGEYRLSEYSKATRAEISAGRTIVNEDSQADPRTAADFASTYGPRGERAYVAVPLMRERRWVGALWVSTDVPRRWEPREVSLLESVAERTWTAIEKLRLEASRRESEERFRTMANAAPTIIWTADASGSITFHNARWLTYTGIAPDQNVDDWPELVLHPDDLDRCVHAWKHAVSTGTEYEIEVRNRRHDGEYRWFLTRATPERDTAGRIVQWIGSSTDIHERKQLEQAVRARESAERSAREHAELLTEIVTELEATTGSRRRAQRLVELLVPRIADFASVSLPGSDDSIAAAGQAEDTVVVALVAGEELQGSLAVGRAGSDRGFSADELTLLRDIADRASLPLANALLEETEQETARRLQRALLPAALHRHPKVDIAARYEAGSDILEVGGDWYDSFELDGGRVGIAVGDVVGHGLDAAAAMGRMRTALAALAGRGGSPSRVLDELNTFAAGPNGTEFATACYAVLDPATGELTYASAGHPPMLLVDPGGAVTWLDGAQSVPLGPSGIEIRREGKVLLEADSLLVAYSDGLVERRGTPLSAGLSRLERVAVGLRREPLEKVCSTLIADLGLESGAEDDIVVMAIRFSPAPTPRFLRGFPARPEELAHMRAEIRAWLAETDVPSELRADVVLAIGEACANAVEHAYVDREPGELEIEIVADEAGGELSVRVRDFGRWREPARSHDDRGRGTEVMRALVEDFDRETGLTGTTVSFRMRQPARTAS